MTADQPMTSRRCTATCPDGSPCRAWAVRGSDPPRCAPHGGGQRPVGAPKDNQNALKHGYYAMCGDTLSPQDCTIDGVIQMLYQKQIALDAYIDRILITDQPSIRQLSHLLRIHGQNASRLGRLLRDRRALGGDALDGLSGAIAQALEELSSELGTDLI